MFTLQIWRNRQLFASFEFCDLSEISCPKLCEAIAVCLHQFAPLRGAAVVVDPFGISTVIGRT